MMQNKIKTAAEARAWFTEHGISIAEWCRENGFGVSLTRQILEGKKACVRGQSHQIAVRLGMKVGVITRRPDEAKQRGPHTQRTDAAGSEATAA